MRRLTVCALSFVLAGGLAQAQQSATEAPLDDPATEGPAPQPQLNLLGLPPQAPAAAAEPVPPPLVAPQPAPAPPPAVVAPPVATPAPLPAPVSPPRTVVINRASADAAAPTPRKKIAVLDLRAGEPTAKAARALTVVVTAEVAAHKDYSAVSRNDLKTLLTHQGDAQLLGCDDVRCMADIAKLVAADLLVAGSVEQIEDAYVFSLELIDPTVPRVVSRQTATWRDDPDRMIELARPYVDRMLGGPDAEAYKGSLEIVAPEGAALVLDGAEMGTAPLARRLDDLASGAHNLTVSKEGFVTVHRDVVVMRGETTLAAIELIDEDSLKPWYSRWWVWGSVGGGLALVGGTAAAIATYAVLSAPAPTTVAIESELPVQ